MDEGAKEVAADEANAFEEETTEAVLGLGEENLRVGSLVKGEGEGVKAETVGKESKQAANAEEQVGFVGKFEGTRLEKLDAAVESKLEHVAF